ncbi:hypothetical protein IHV10_00420 [Fictibacillus sp. 5RED26]|jgi:hypothetical protein|uniref:hypothetical protein n=1 Tax=Fictibacillus TaxID=1329200 RepID=UPI0018CE9D0E|nr:MULTISPECIES: hypothetical protein [unclassified Fictibacillus]MBH0154803.1 hypothetical protein [Fictibacillus sp. 5RED26]MBH0162651.1 hypothetical protein [Fictibacillus sp. 26RED30]MBH0165415.1 hypothetical protein [Fictibacillus sp. 7GRE50]MBH0171992.1 hypothetical protein [Fictibacillus sp. 23RED33]
MIEKLILGSLVVLLYFDYQTLKQDKKSKKIYLMMSIPAGYMLYSYLSGRNLPNLDEGFQLILGPIAEVITSWLQVKS